jgi:hypothetical protein
MTAGLRTGEHLRLDELGGSVGELFEFEGMAADHHLRVATGPGQVVRFLHHDDGEPPHAARPLGRRRTAPAARCRQATRPVFRFGVSALALLSPVLLVAVGADTNRLLPLFAIGVFIGFTISEIGLVQHWRTHRSGPRPEARHRG